MGKYFMEASVAIQVLPSAKDDKDLLRIVDEIILHIKNSGYNYYVGPFETTVEGDFEGLMKIVKDCQLIAMEKGASSVISYVKIFYNPNKGVLTIDEKVTKHHE